METLSLAQKGGVLFEAQVVLVCHCSIFSFLGRNLFFPVLRIAELLIRQKAKTGNNKRSLITKEHQNTVMEYESVVLVKQEVFVYKIPPRQSNRGHRAADWNLAEPTWTGRLRMVSKGKTLAVKLEDKNSGALFANCPIESYPGVAIESVSDSSRYFVLRIQDDNGSFDVYFPWDVGF